MNILYGELEQAGLAPATRKLVHAVLSGACTDAVRWERIARNPAGAADPPSVPRSKARAWSPRELRIFLEHVRDERLAALWRTAATTGLRRGEQLGLTWRALDLEGARLRIEQQVLPVAGVCPTCGAKHSCSFGSPKWQNSERTVSLDADTVAALCRHRECQRLERDVAGPAYVDHDLVFCDELGGPIHPQRLTEWASKLRKAAGLSFGSTHTLRHTHAAQTAAALLVDSPLTNEVVSAV